MPDPLADSVGLLNGEMTLVGKDGGYLSLRAVNFIVPKSWEAFLASAVEAFRVALQRDDTP